MKKLLLAGGAGAAAMYFLDGERGPARRRRMLSVWRDGREVALEAGHGAAQVVQPLSPVPQQIMNRIDSVHGSKRHVVLKRIALGVGLVGLVAAASRYIFDSARARAIAGGTVTKTETPLGGGWVAPVVDAAPNIADSIKRRAATAAVEA